MELLLLKSMRKRQLFILGLKILVFLGGIFVVLIFLTRNNSPNASIVTNITENIQEKWKYIQTMYVQDSASHNRALHYANEKACQNITNEDQKQECIDYALIAKFLKDSNTADCSVIINENRNIECKNLLYEKTAIDAKNKNLCKNIANEEIAQRCRESIDASILAEISKNYSASAEVCAKLENTFQEECNKLINNYEIEVSYSEAIKKQDIALCAIIGESSLEQKCRNNIIANKAITEGNVLMCEYISDTNQKQNCLENTQLQRDTQLFEIATNSDNINLCNRITIESIQHRCNDIVILSITKKTKNTSLCQNLKNKENISICQKLLNS